MSDDERWQPDGAPDGGGKAAEAPPLVDLKTSAASQESSGSQRRPLGQGVSGRIRSRNG